MLKKYVLCYLCVVMIILFVVYVMVMLVVVSLGDLQGWILGDGSSGILLVMIISDQVYQGNGLIQFIISVINQQLLVVYLFGVLLI